MTRARSPVLALALALLTGAPTAAQEMFVEGCNLGCAGGAGGGPVTCGIVHVFVNQDVRVRFSLPVDVLSLNASTVRLVNVANGTSPQGTTFVDPADDRTLVFRPSMTWDAGGNLVTGFEANATYQILLPGRNQGDAPPYVLSTDGRPNRTRMDCTVATDLGVFPPVWPFCGTSPNSQGPGATIGGGDTSVSNNAFTVDVSQGVPGATTLLLLGNGRTELPLADGRLCVGGRVQRFPPTAFDGLGSLHQPVDLLALPFTIAPGETWYFQVAYRDPLAGGSGYNFSEALQAQFYP